MKSKVTFIAPEGRKTCGDGTVREALERDDEGPFDVRIEVADLEAAGDFLASVGIVPEESARNGEINIPPESAFGAPLILAAPRG